jgi:ACS family allantoate permease-like MFS transporter
MDTPPEKSRALRNEKEPIPGISQNAIRSGSVMPEKILKHSQDADAALKAFAGYEGAVIEIDEATNKRLLRKIDMHLMPVSNIIPEYGVCWHHG